MREDTSMEQQILYQERPRAAVGSKAFIILEMLALIFSRLATFVSRLFLDTAASSIPTVMVFFWIFFFLYIAAYILLLIGTSSRNNIGVLIAGFAAFLILEWESFISNFSLSGFTEKLAGLPLLDSIVLYSFTFVWVFLIVLTCIKKAPKPLCLIPGLIGVGASLLQLYLHLMEIARWSSLSDLTDGKEVAYVFFGRASSLIYILVILFRPFWIFMVSHWLTHPTKKIPVRQGFMPITPQPYGVPVQPYQAVPNGYQQMPQYQQGYQQIPQQGYPQYGQPQQFPPQQ